MSHAALAAVALVAVARAALATSAADVCAPGADPCVVERTIAVSPDSILDFGTRRLEVRQRGVLDVGAAAMTIRAASVRLLPGGALLGRGGATGGTIAVVTTGALAVEASGTTDARIDVSGDAQGGRIDITAGGAVTLDGTLIARAATSDGRGGTIVVGAGSDLTVGGPVTASGGSQEIGGDVTLSAARALSVGDVIDASGGSGGGGSITLEAGSIDTSARLDVSARTSGGDGGAISLTANGNVSLRGPIAAGSACGVTAGCATTGGELGIDAGGAVTIDEEVGLSGAGPDGTGGTLEIDAGTDVVQSAAVLAEGRGSDGCGGEVTITAGRNLTAGAIDLSGGFCGGGTATLEATATAALAGELTADSRTTGPGGDVSVIAETVGITGRVHANGASLTGGLLTVDGCGLDVAAGAQVQTRGSLGANVLSASGQMVVAGVLTSGTGTDGAGGQNELRFRDQTMRPIIAGTASITPTPLLVHAPELPPCGGTLPPGCGNGQLDAGETCDDGNIVACDGCSASCALEGCGNGRVECTEGCDDNNAVACDGCSPICRPERCGNGVIECSEECDAGAANGTPGSGCDAGCRIPPPVTCGNGVQDPDEGCDDGNTTACDGCSRTCQPEACGNGVRECSEQCDDANLAACDGCAACRLEQCGDAIRECDEECDDGAANGTPGATCDTTCHRGTVCGLGTTEPPCIPCARDTDCDPLGRCAGRACSAGVCASITPFNCTDASSGTLDVCVLDEGGFPFCTHACLADSGCSDGNPCNGAEVCAAGICAAGTPPSCEDGDPCSDDGCDPSGGCVHSRQRGLAGAVCRVDAMQATVTSASEADLGGRLRAQLLRRLGLLRGRLDAVTAAAEAGDVRRERRLLGRGSRDLVRAGQLIGRARKHGRIEGSLADTLLTALTAAFQMVGEVRASLAP